MANKFRNMKNVIITSHETVAAAYWEMAQSMLEEGQALQEGIDAEAIYDVVKSIPGEGPLVDTNRAAKVLETFLIPEETADDKRKGMTIEQRIAVSREAKEAYDIGHSLSEDTQHLFEEVANAKEQLDGAPLPIAKRLRDEIGIDKVLGWPLPGLRHDSKDYADMIAGGYNGKPDYYVINNGTGKPTKASFYHDMFLGTIMGGACNEAKNLLTAMRTSATSVSVPAKERLRQNIAEICGEEGLPVDKALSGDSVSLNSLTAFVNRRATTAEGKLRSAVKLLHQAYAMENAGYSIRLVDGGSLMKANDKEVAIAARKRDPLVICWPSKQADGTTILERPQAGVSIGTFNKYKVRQAIDAAAKANETPTFAHLRETLKRDIGEKKPGQTDNSMMAPKIENVNKLDEVLSEVMAYVDNGDHYETILQAATTGDKDRRKRLVLSLGKTYDFLSEIMPKLTKAYRAYVAEDAEAAEAEAEEKSTAKAKAGNGKQAHA